MLTLKEKLIWVAGFFDGEGNISLSLSRNNVFSGMVSLSQKDPSILQTIREVLCEAGVEGSTVSPFRSSGGVHYLNFYSTRGTDFLLLVLPYLQHPKHKIRADIYIEFYPKGTFGDKTRRAEKEIVWKKWCELAWAPKTKERNLIKIKGEIL